MEIIANPRLVDVFGLDILQEDVDFAIPRLDEDIPLYIDPFLLWNSTKSEYQELHARLIQFFCTVAEQVRRENLGPAARLLAGCQEHASIGLGYASGSKRGSGLGPVLIASILAAYADVPQLSAGDMRHIEELQLVVPKLAEDRISDVASSVMMDYLVEYSESCAKRYGIPTRPIRPPHRYDSKTSTWGVTPVAGIPFNPADNSPILLVPLDLLRHLPWINYGDYYRTCFVNLVSPSERKRRQVAKEAVLKFNARNYVQVERYVTGKEKLGNLCKPDPLFSTLSVGTLKKKHKELKALPTGTEDGADRKYEDLAFSLLRSLFYPTLEFAEDRVRTVSGAHIRDIIFYNDGKNPFWSDLRDRYEARQPVFELKNVHSLETEHVNQLYRYLDEEFGRFGVLVTRMPAPKAVQRNIVDLHSSKRVVILCIDDRDIELTFSLVDAGRDPTDVIKKKYIEFTRLLPN